MTPGPLDYEPDYMVTTGAGKRASAVVMAFSFTHVFMNRTGMTTVVRPRAVVTM